MSPTPAYNQHARGINPSPFSAKRLIVLLAALAVTLGCGTGYAYSAYAPQLGSRLKINHTQLNVIGMAMSLGAYSTGPIWGRIVDLRGPRIPFTISFFFFLFGYLGTRIIYDRGLSPHENTLHPFPFILLVLCGMMMGAGGNAGSVCAINSTAKTFPDSARATAVGLVLSGVGISAFFFSTISRMFFPGDTSHFLLVLALGTALPMIIGFLLVRPIPLPNPGSKTSAEPQAGTSISDVDGLIGDDTPLLPRDDVDSDVESMDARGGMVEGRVSEAVVGGSEHQQHNTFISRRRALLMGDPTLTNVYRKGLAKSSDFWLLFTIFSLLSGTGIMYINNVGSMSQVLYAMDNPAYDDVEASKWQTTQVSAISIMNCAGRLVIGLICDYGKSRLGIPRSTSLILVSFLFSTSQVAAASVGNVENLWVASSLLGFAYGSLFSLLATICSEWFGMSHYAENWGYIVMAPIFAGNLFSLIFGRNLDAHESVSRHMRGGHMLQENSKMMAPPHCVLGKGCYVATLYLTIVACLLAMMLSIWTCWRDREKLRKAALLVSGER